ncbi:TetR family transcriptional regulator [Paraburkholderia sp. BL6669N2]|uniref:TetR/AcrR family transcriptional regulator n=1 Tax=Paraburkholderia sp. BL6669N2 TaxID=1938807 RepID=UPI000E21C4AA|nr:TetR/AcrR family transcriptional regulator [Paraburkholderia sp. BL6669N2]REG49011.1 TetR family transcriptional regulator [Paraburkholderia sp. BL6669N2]
MQATPPDILSLEDSPHVLRPLQRRSREALAKIISAAELLLRTEGIDGFSIAAVAEKAGLPVGNIYRRFRAKEDILAVIKQEVTDRIEQAVIQRLQEEQFTDIRRLVAALVDVLVKSFCRDEALHKVLFDRRVKDPALSQIGSLGRRHIYLQYRAVLTSVLPPLKTARTELIATFSFQIIASAIVGKASGNDGALVSMPWKTLATEASAAAVAYLEAAI